MTNIWAFLNQTLSVSIIAVLLLVIKYILKDKLSPRWQYGVWIVLALRIIIPVNIYKLIGLKGIKVNINYSSSNSTNNS